MRYHDLRHTFATLALEQGMDVKSLSAVLGHVSSDITLDIYAHITTDMQIEAARSIDRSIGKASELDSRSTVKVDDKPKDDFKPVLNTTRRHPGMGCISEINDHLYEGRWSPKWIDGKRISRNVYIEAHIQDIYGVEVSDTTVSRITDKILPIAKEWQQRPLESVYAVVFLDAIHYHVRSEGQIVKKAVYIAIGINLDGKKDVLGMWVGENESAKFWATVLNSLKNRGVADIFIACTDNLTGFSAAIEAVFPKTEVQNCIVHQLRNSSKYVSYKGLKALMADLKAVYAAVDEPTALDALDTFAKRWDKKYPKISQSWRDNWPNLSTYFKYPQEVRRLIYTTNTIEGFNRQLRKVTKAKSVFPTDDSLLKMLYLAMIDITKKWTGRRQDWSMIHAQLAVFFADRMPE